MILFLGEHRNYSNLHDFWIISFLYDFASGPGEKECLILCSSPHLCFMLDFFLLVVCHSRVSMEPLDPVELLVPLVVM